MSSQVPTQLPCPAPGWGFFLSGVLLGVTRLLCWSFGGDVSLAAAATDAAQFLSVGAALGAVLSLLAPARSKRALYPLLLCALSYGLGLFTLGEDLEHFSTRQQLLPPSLVYHFLIVLLSGTLPAAFFLAHALRTPRLRGLSLLCGVLLVWLGDRVLVHDYPGIHFLTAMIALVLSGQALTHLFPSAWLKAPPRLAWPLAGVLISVPLFVLPSSKVSAHLANSSGAAFAPIFARLQQKIAHDEAPATDGSTSEWFKDRSSHPDVPPTDPPLLPKNLIVVLITVDAVRADLLLNRKHDQQLPTFARLRDEGVSFTQARSPGTLTKVSLSGLFLGTYFSQQYWSQMEGRDRGILSVHEDETPRFPALLRKNGVRTANVRSVSWLRNDLILGGFQTDTYIPYPKKESYYTPSPPVMKEVRKKLSKYAKKATPAFIYSHLSDPHAPYDQGKKKKGSAFERYVSEVALVDSQLALLVEQLSKENLRDRCLLIVSADHGEAFGEHKSNTHGTTLYDEGMHVPLFFWRPDGESKVVDDLVSLIDLGPTVLDAFSLATPGISMGQSLLAYLTDEPPRLTRPILSETRLMRALVSQERMKLILDTRSGRKELYDLKTDPSEEHNLADDKALLLPVQRELEAFFVAHQIRREGYELPYLR